MKKMHLQKSNFWGAVQAVAWAVFVNCLAVQPVLFNISKKQTDYIVRSYKNAVAPSLTAGLFKPALRRKQPEFSRHSFC